MVYFAAAFTALSLHGDRRRGAARNQCRFPCRRTIFADAPLEITPAPPLPIVWGASLATVAVKNGNTGAHADLRLYSDHGSLELDAMKEFMRVGATTLGADEPLDARLIQLTFRAAYHFGGAPITIISATRKGAHGKHSNGSALDFSLEGVSAKDLAKYIRQYPRAGVGIYTHPKTQYVHLDVRLTATITGSTPRPQAERGVSNCSTIRRRSARRLLRGDDGPPEAAGQ